jgi:hypothetical protein
MPFWRIMWVDAIPQGAPAMNCNQSVISNLVPVLLAWLCVAIVPGMALASESDQVEREARRLEGELRWQQEMARRDIEDRERAQAEALRGQEEAIRRMEATRARIEANAPQTAPPYVEPARIYIYPRYTPNEPQATAQADRARPEDAVTGMIIAPLSEQLGSYFGVQTGVLVVRAGADRPFGLQDGDVVLWVDGRVPADDQHLAGILRSYKPGERAKLKIQRSRRTIELDTTAPGQGGN